MSDNLKKLPFDIEVERALLCAILIDEDFNEKLKDISLKSDYFYQHEHKTIFDAVLRLQTAGSNVDPLTLKNELVKMNKLSEIGGPAYLAELLGAVPTSANIRYYAEIVENKYLLRSIISTTTNAAEDAFSETIEAKELLDSVSSELFLLSEKRAQNVPEKINNAIIETMSMIDDWSKRGGAISGISTGYKELDEYTAGWQKNALIVLAARPGMGKTQLALNLATNACKTKEKYSIAYFSLEMGKHELIIRLLSMESSVPMQNIKKGRLSASDWQKLPIAMEKLGNLNLYIDDSSSLNILDLRTKCRRLKKDKNIDMVVVDYLGLMETESGLERHEGISRISRALKGLARELEIPVLVLAQLNREVEKRPDKRPMPSDLRDSGAIEQDADLILFIVRPEVYKMKDSEGNDMEGIAEIIIGKQRSGPTGIVKLYFDKKNLKFVELDTTTQYSDAGR
ncbi:MAG: replicative DNA helicase [Candidatus Delongbacteria bacterium]|nr:replicative DNA helicase [Candidatus Delongbacteria bacterium]MBN2836475.1 replicative DNA helicase [Candidatus Delongbacteria bacterium]